MSRKKLRKNDEEQKKKNRWERNSGRGERLGKSRVGFFMAGGRQFQGRSF